MTSQQVVAGRVRRAHGEHGFQRTVCPPSRRPSSGRIGGVVARSAHAQNVARLELRSYSIGN